ncbi:AAA family ATPase [candidate division KSB1 bacterium]|nr:AAA family ATPase [candidate division KSB1 bacterium]
MHLTKIRINSERYPTTSFYPFNLNIFEETQSLTFQSPVAFFVGENGSGKSTLLRAICQRCGVHIWEDNERIRFQNNPFENRLFQAIDIEWINGSVPGSYFGSQIFQNFAQFLDEWAIADPKMLDYFGGKSLMTQSHGQSLMSYFASRYQRKGIYFLDEPETALSPKSQLELLKLVNEMGDADHAQFIIATHSPILLSCEGAEIFNFDSVPIEKINYEETDHFMVYRDFFKNREL